MYTLIFWWKIYIWMLAVGLYFAFDFAIESDISATVDNQNIMQPTSQGMSN